METDAPKLTVHIVFCENDKAFADRLITCLKACCPHELIAAPVDGAGKTGSRSQASPPLGAADTVLIVLSPDAIDNSALLAHVQHVNDISKRALGLVAKSLARAGTPSQIEKLQLKSMDDERSFQGGIQRLAQYLNEDRQWIRKHTELYMQALRWKKEGYAEKWALSGTDITTAKIWTFERPRNAPKPTDLHLKYIEQSEATQKEEPVEAPETYEPPRQITPVEPEPVEAPRTGLVGKLRTILTPKAAQENEPDLEIAAEPVPKAGEEPKATDEPPPQGEEPLEPEDEDVEPASPQFLGQVAHQVYACRNEAS